MENYSKTNNSSHLSIYIIYLAYCTLSKVFSRNACNIVLATLVRTVYILAEPRWKALCFVENSLEGRSYVALGHFWTKTPLKLLISVVFKYYSKAMVLL